MDYTKDDIIPLYGRFPDGIYNQYGQVTYDKTQFEKRFEIFTQGLLDNFEYENAILCGGSLFNSMDVTVNSDDFTTLTSDLDLFILKTGDIPKTLTKLENVLQHFENYAKNENLEIIYISRGALVEVMIQTKRRIQILLTVYDNEEDCIANMSVVHLHIYYNGELNASNAAIDNIIRRETRMCRAPIKDTKIPQLISHNITPVGDILQTRMDEEFHQTLDTLSQIKVHFDIHGNLNKFNLPTSFKYDITTDILKVIEYTQDELNANWNHKRMAYLTQMNIKQDIDVFDLNIRLPAPDILFRCTFFRGKKKEKVLKIKTAVKIPSPAIFMERGIFLKKAINLDEDVVDVDILRTDNIRYLERYFSRQAVFRYNKDVTHVTQANIDVHQKLNITFMILINDGIQSVMFFDLVQMIIA